jgi:hypothetical protein
MVCAEGLESRTAEMDFRLYSAVLWRLRRFSGIEPAYQENALQGATFPVASSGVLTKSGALRRYRPCR